MKPVSQIITFSTYRINGLDTFYDGNIAYLAVALDSGQVNIYQAS
jgi:hypothetical protein